VEAIETMINGGSLGKGGGGRDSSKDIKRIDAMIEDLQNEMKKRAMIGHVDQVKADLIKKMDNTFGKSEF
jgi:hypothetical protein